MQLFISTLFSLCNVTLFAQSNQFTGDYIRLLSEEGKHTIEYKLTLNQDGTFLFHSYSKTRNGTPPEVNKYGKGKWSVKDNLISFSQTNKKISMKKIYFGF